ncbi:MAG: phosphonate C-P lyase system protein PhnH [Magnetospiraceae bacterium]
MDLAPAPILPGFPDSVTASQRVFRAVLTALSQPGLIVPLVDLLECPAPLRPTTNAVLLALADFETPVWLDPEFTGAHDHLTFHCGCPVTDNPGEAAFAVASAPPDLAQFAWGSPEYPERSTTVIIQVPDLKPASGVRLTGPGIAQYKELAVDGLDASFWDQLDGNIAAFPCGIDVIFAAADKIAALPRTTRVER